MSTFVGVPRMPAPPAQEASDAQKKVVRMACSLLLDYPMDDLGEKISAIRAELPGLPTDVAAHLGAFCDEADAIGLRDLQILYVETFDQKRRCALGLTYYSHGDTRSRGQAIIGFKELLRRAGWENEREELPDHLPLILEFAALDETGSAEHLLQVNRQGIEVVRSALRATSSPWAHLLEALVLTLPEPSDEVIAAYQKLVSQGPPTELVGVGNLDLTPSPISSEER
ncbi:MAG: nitrate reductase molybdenum cofactor assembly chaperone [Actinomycetaceae bacterium]|nr:nitrate reductase molybdenum cofactor assembly chaperone [Actinomycetaceae bacterium]